MTSASWIGRACVLAKVSPGAPRSLRDTRCLHLLQRLESLHPHAPQTLAARRDDLKYYKACWYKLSILVLIKQTQMEGGIERHLLNPYDTKGLGYRLYATLHKMPGEVGYSFCLFLKS